MVKKKEDILNIWIFESSPPERRCWLFSCQSLSEPWWALLRRRGRPARRPHNPQFWHHCHHCFLIISPISAIIMNIWRRGWLTREVKVSFLVTQSQYIGRNDKLRSSSVGSYKSLLLPIYPLLAFVDPQKKTNWIAAQWNTNQLGNLLWHTQAQIFTQVVQYLDI